MLTLDKPFSPIRIAPMVIDELPRGVNFFLKFLKGSCIYLAILLLKNGTEFSPKVPYETVIFP